ncbi:hypothetical protein D3C81_1796090 [compost metagenome]
MTDHFKKQKGIKKVDNKYYNEWIDFMKKYYPEWTAYPAYIWRGWGYMSNPNNQQNENEDSPSKDSPPTDSQVIDGVGGGDSGGAE